MEFYKNEDLLKNISPFFTGRLDIKNYGNEDNSIKILSNSDDSSQIYRWSWFNDDKGEGVTIQSIKTVLDLKIKCINDGVLNLFLRSKDIKDKNNIRFPIYIDYTNLKINDIPLLTGHNLFSHDDPYIFEKNVLDDEILSIHCEWLPFNSSCELTNPKLSLSLNQDFSNLKNDFYNFKRSTEVYLDSYNFLFNKLFIDFNQEPVNTMKDLRLVCTELLTFVNNVCKKYDLNWWLDFGNLLGAVRHNNFVPWDDDVDIGMIRKDYNKLNEVIAKEINENNLNDIITLVYKERKIDGKDVGSFLQILIFHNYNNTKILFAGVDVFPYDFLKTYDDIDSLSKLQHEARLSYYRNLANNISYEKSLRKCYEDLGCSLDETSYIIPGVETGTGINNMFPLYVLDTEKVFPLKLRKFGDNMFPCPNETDSYLRFLYGDYMALPKSIHHHGRVEKFRYIKDAHEILTYYINILKDVNSNYD